MIILIRTEPVRVVKPVKNIYETMSSKLGIPLSDLVSAILLYAATNPSLLAHILSYEYDLDLETSRSLAYQLSRDVLTKFGRVLY